MRKFTNVAKKIFTAALCACLFFNTGLTALAEENAGDPEAEPLTTAPALTVTPAELTLTNGQFTVIQSLASAEQSEVEKAVEQINAQLLQIPCSGPSFAYAGAGGDEAAADLYYRYDGDVIYQINEEAVAYLARYIRDAQLAEEAELAFQTLQATPDLDADTLTGGQYAMECAQVSAINDAMTYTRTPEGVNQVTMRISARYLTAYPVDGIEQPVTYVLAGESATDYHGSTLDRVTNLKLASRSLSERVVKAGESVSCSTIFGPRTLKNGYRMAPQFINGKKADGVGGGICQVSTTIYQALMNAGVTVTRRHPHSQKVDYAERGMDSAISQGYKDLIFRNDYMQPIYIQSQVQDAYVTCKIYVAASDAGTTRYKLWAVDTGKLTADTYLTTYVDGVETQTRYVDSSRYYR